MAGRTFIFILLLLSASCSLAATVDEWAARVEPLIDPAKLATLGVRGANQRVQKYVYHLATAREAGVEVRRVVSKAVSLAGYTNSSAAELTRAAMMRNLDIATKLGCLDADGLSEMRKGKAATVRNGPYKGDELSVDHIIPRSVVPELDNVIANLELLPGRLNSKKNATVGKRQKNLAVKLHQAKLLSSEGLNVVQRAQ